MVNKPLIRDPLFLGGNPWPGGAPVDQPWNLPVHVQEAVNACCHLEALEEALIKEIRGAGPGSDPDIRIGWPPWDGKHTVYFTYIYLMFVVKSR